MSHSGRIGRRFASLRRDGSDRLRLRWGASRLDLADVVVRHRDEDGRIAFSLSDAASGELLRSARYRRRGPRRRDMLMGVIDFTADEPWTWEDRDFGLFVFHVATGTGPIKYRHRIEARHAENGDDAERRSLRVSDDRVMRGHAGGRPEVVAFAELSEVRVKFELSGIWSDAALLTLDSPHDLVVVPLGSRDRVAQFEAELLPRLRRLAGWGAAADAAIRDACEYGLRDSVGPTAEEPPWSRAERPVWNRPPGT